MASKQLTCAGCRSTIIARHYLTCCLCAEMYDLDCANMPEARYFGTINNDKVNSWKCPCCMNKIPKGCNTNTPVAAARGDRIRSPEDPCETSPTSSGSEPDNINMRRGTGGPDAVKVPDRSFMDDSYYLDNIRTIMRDELERVVEDRLAAIITKAVAEQTVLATMPLHNEIISLKERVAALENLAKNPQMNQVPNPPSSSGSGGLREEAITQLLPRETPLSTLSKDHPAKQSFVTEAPIGQPCVGELSVTQPKQTEHMRPNTDNMKLTKQSSPASSSSTLGVHKAPPRKEPESTEKHKHESEGWTEVTKKHRASAPIGVMRGAAAPGTTKIEAAERRKLLHLYYVKEGTTVEQVLDHLNSFTNRESCKVVALKARGNYASFKLDVPSKCADTIMAPENWAEGICVKPWRQTLRSFRSQTNHHQETEKS